MPTTREYAVYLRQYRDAIQEREAAEVALATDVGTDKAWPALKDLGIAVLKVEALAQMLEDKGKDLPRKEVEDVEHVDHFAEVEDVREEAVRRPYRCPIPPRSRRYNHKLGKWAWEDYSKACPAAVVRKEKGRDCVYCLQHISSAIPAPEDDYMLDHFDDGLGGPLPISRLGVRQMSTSDPRFHLEAIQGSFYRLEGPRVNYAWKAYYTSELLAEGVADPENPAHWLPVPDSKEAPDADTLDKLLLHLDDEPNVAWVRPRFGGRFMIIARVTDARPRLRPGFHCKMSSDGNLTEDFGHREYCELFKTLKRRAPKGAAVDESYKAIHKVYGRVMADPQGDGSVIIQGKEGTLVSGRGSEFQSFRPFTKKIAASHVDQVLVREDAVKDVPAVLARVKARAVARAQNKG